MPGSTSRTALAGTDGSSTTCRTVDNGAALVGDAESHRARGDMLAVRTTGQSQ